MRELRNRRGLLLPPSGWRGPEGKEKPCGIPWGNESRSSSPKPEPKRARPQKCAVSQLRRGGYLPPRNEARTLVSLSPPGTNAPGPSRRGGSEDPDTCGKSDTNPHRARKPPSGKQARRGARRKPYGASPREATERERSSWEGKTCWQRNELLRPRPATPESPGTGKPVRRAWE